MRIHYTNGRNQDLITLCRLLDEALVEMAGGKKKQSQYIQYNSLSDIEDAFIAYKENIPIACGAFKHYSDGVAEVKRVFTIPEFRGKGISSLLMKAIEEKAIEKGFHTLILETGKPLKAAISLYQGLGFSIISNYGQYKDMPDSICMQKVVRQE